MAVFKTSRYLYMNYKIYIMKKLKTISQFESENQLEGSELQSVKGGDIGRTSNLIQGATAATTEGGDTDCSNHIVDDYGKTILLYINF